MKRLSNFMLAVLTSLSLVLSSCATFKDNQNTAKLVTTYAVLKTLEQSAPEVREERKVRIRTIATDVQSLAVGTGEVTLDFLKAEVEKRLPTNLSPADKFLASALVEAVVTELQSRVGAGLLSEDQKYQVSTVLQWVIDATKL